MTKVEFRLNLYIPALDAVCACFLQILINAMIGKGNYFGFSLMTLHREPLALS